MVKFCCEKGPDAAADVVGQPGEEEEAVDREGVEVMEEGDGVADEVPLTALAVLLIT